LPWAYRSTATGPELVPGASWKTRPLTVILNASAASLTTVTVARLPATVVMGVVVDVGRGRVVGGVRVVT